MTPHSPHLAEQSAPATETSSPDPLPNLPLPAQSCSGSSSSLLSHAELQWLLSTTQQLHEVRPLEGLLEAVVTAIRQHLQVDRVLIYRFQTETYGLVVAESLTDGYTPSLNVGFPAIAFGAATPQVAQQQVVMFDNVEQDLSPHQQQMMAQLQTRASLSLPILLGEVWGLLVLQHCEPKAWRHSEVVLLHNLVVELRLRLQALEVQLQLQRRGQQQQSFAHLVDQIYQLLDADSLERIFRSAAQDLRRQLQCDRLLLCRFTSDEHATVVAESVAPQWEPMAGAGDQDWIESLPNREHYQAGKGLAVEDVQQIAQPALPTHLLERLAVKGYAIAPILKSKTPWGLIIACQSSGPRRWTLEDTTLLAQVAQVLGLALHQTNYRKKLQTQAERMVQISARQRLMDQVVDRIQQCVDLQRTLTITCREIRHFLKSDCTAIYRLDEAAENSDGEIVAEDMEPVYRSTLVASSQDYGFSESLIDHCRRGRIWYVSDVQQSGSKTGLADRLSHLQAKAALVVPLMNDKKLWGLFCNYQCGAPRNWKNDEIQFVERIAAQLNTAIQQGEYIEALRHQSERLREAAEQERLISQVVDRIRRSLDLQHALGTTAREIRHFLKADRVAIFKFAPNSNCSQGETVAEDVHPGYASALKVHVEDHCFSQGFAEQYKRGRVWAVGNIYKAGIQQCYLDVLAQFQVQANLVVPLLQGDNLWGLFCIHQCDRPRDWQVSEISFAKRIAAQLDVAIQQGNSLKALQNRTTQLTKMVEENQAEKAQIREQVVQLLSVVSPPEVRSCELH